MTPVWFAAAVSDWDKIFDELYLRTYANMIDNDLAPAQAGSLVRLVGLEAGTDLLDGPCRSEERRVGQECRSRWSASH